jgi:hypothetical protein
LDEIVEADAQHPGDELEKTQPPPVAVLAQVGGERFYALSGRPAATVVFLPEGRREAFLVLAPGHLARERLARADGRQHAAFGVGALEGVDLGVGPARFRRVRRTEDDEELGRSQRHLDLVGEIVGCGELMLVAEDRLQPLRDDSVGRKLALEGMRDVEILKLAVKPFGELLVLMAVAEEGIIAVLVVSLRAADARNGHRMRLRCGLVLRHVGELQHRPCPLSLG